MTHYLVTGASGLLGLNFALAVDGKKHKVTGIANTLPMRWVNFQNLQIELTEPGVVEKMIDEVKPDVILHCAAMANLEACEADQGMAQRVNAILPGEIASKCSKHSIRMIQISTDAVFDGLKGNYTETDVPNPINTYARTKLEGEIEVLTANPHALVTRVNFYGWSAAGNRSLAENFVHELETGNQVMGFTDVQFCPMNLLDLTEILVEASEKQLSGLFHVVGPEAMSKYQFAVKLAEKFGFDPALIRPVSVKESGLEAARSPNLTLSIDKIRQALVHDLPSFDSGLQKFHHQYRRGYPQYIRNLG